MWVWWVNYYDGLVPSPLTPPPAAEIQYQHCVIVYSRSCRFFVFCQLSFVNCLSFVSCQLSYVTRIFSIRKCCNTPKSLCEGSISV